MQFNKPPSRGYLYRTLVQGARPFLYRGGVRLLLGLAPAGAGKNWKMTFYRVPPVGFRYARFPLMSAAIRGPRGAGSLLESASLRSSSVKDLQYASSESNLRLLRAKVGDKVPADKVPGKEVGKVGKEAEPVEAGKVDENIKVTCKESEKVEKVPVIHDGAPSPEDYEISQTLLEVQKPFLEKVSGRRRLIERVPGKIEQQEQQEIDIPGFSRESISFPSLFLKTGSLKHMIPNPEVKKVPGKEVGIKVTCKESEKVEKVPAIHDGAPSPEDYEISQKLLEVQKPFLEKVSGRRRLIERVPGKVEHQKVPGKVEADIKVTGKKIERVDERVPGSHEVAPRPGTMKFNKSFCGVQGPAARGANKGFLQKEPLAAEGPNPSRREMVRAVQQVERLRQEVHRLHSRVLAASREHTETTENRETGEEKRELLSSRQPKPKMAFTPQGPQRRQRQTPRIPCAFWERNYLGRFLLRMSR